MTKPPKIAVVGAGVVGMTLARLLQEKLTNASITVYADKFKQDTTSHVAAGFFRPGTSFKGATNEITKKWMEDSWLFWQDILKTAEAPAAGVMTLSAYIFSKENYHVTRNHLIEDLVPVYRPVTDEELKVTGGSFKYGSFFSTLKVECERYLPWTEKIFLARGGVIENRKIENLASLSDFDLVFNCTGLGAKYLCDDHDLVPIRGQIIKVRAPWVKTAFYGDYDTYIIPGFDGMVTLGGVRQYESYNLKVCKYDAASIMERCCELLPSLKKAEVVDHQVGLRPHRSVVRVEPQLVGGATGAKELRVVHCYGHGGYGVMCAPGTALQAIDIGLNFLRSNTRNKL